MNRRYSILLLVPHFGGGGAERVMAHLACSLPGDRFDVHVGLVTRKDASPEKLPPQVHVHGIGASRALFGTAGIVRLVQRIRPDLILATMSHLNVLVLLLRPLFPGTTRILIRQNGVLPVRMHQIASHATQLLYKLAYLRADGIICQTRAMAAEMGQLLGTAARISVLRNPVDVQSVRGALPSKDWVGPGPHLLSVARLSPEKGVDLLLDAFTAVRGEFPAADLVILGEGVERKRLQARSAALGLGSCVRFRGYVTEPAAWFAGATLLVIPSRQEAFPNVLLEGAAAGLPVVAMPCSGGITELLRGQSGAWLARDVSSGALGRSLRAALGALRPGERFRHLWLDAYDLKRAIPEYEAVILETLGAAG